MQEIDEADRRSGDALESGSQAQESVPRRRFLEASAAATAGVLGLNALDGQAESGSVDLGPSPKKVAAKKGITLDRVNVSLFEPCVGDTFLARADDGRTFQLELIVAEALEPLTGVSHLGVREDPFSLIFMAPASSQLGQGTYAMSHSKLGELTLFVVPIGPSRDGTGLRYQAVIA
jgi:hypothetical protein